MLRISTFKSVTRFDLARTLAGRGRYWTTAYFVDGVLIDSGCAHTALELVKVLDGKQLTHIINTHSHEDHFGANGVLQQLHPNIEILAHPLALPVMKDPHGQIHLHPYRRLFWGEPSSCIASPVADEARIEIRNLRLHVFFTPGHSPDHISLFEPDRGWLFTGDLFVGGWERALREGYDIWQIIESLKRVNSLSASVMFPGSARIRENPKAELDAKIAYLEEFGGKVLDLNRKGLGVNDIVRALCGRPMFIELVTLGNFTRRHLVLSYLRGSANR
jgi:glyoxylase-like metal-dependent hydrolase (beta-lactamase superfamily II)